MLMPYLTKHMVCGYDFKFTIQAENLTTKRSLFWNISESLVPHTLLKLQRVIFASKGRFNNVVLCLDVMLSQSSGTTVLCSSSAY